MNKVIEADGVLMGRYSNRRSVPMGQIELATFRDLQCSQPFGSSVWIATSACGERLAGTPGSNNFRVLQLGALEDS